MLTIYICVGSACHLKGSYNIINDLQKIIDEKGMGGRVTVKAAMCLGKCTEGVSAKVEDSEVVSLSKTGLKEFFEYSVMSRLKLEKEMD